MNELEIILAITIPVYGALGFLASKRYDKFKKLFKPFMFIIGSFIVLGFVWDFSASVYNLRLIGNIPSDITEGILEKHSLGLLYITLLPIITLAYINILDFIFKPN